MSRADDWRGFYFITDRGLSVNGVLEDTRQALAAGVVMVQYREKSAPRAERLAEARAIQQLCQRFSTPFIVNDDVELARELSADGAHVGQEDAPYPEARKMLGPDAIIGVSAANVAEAVLAEKQGADYVGAGAIFATSTKADAGAAIGVPGLIAIREAISIPIAAIGGITIANAGEVYGAGAEMVCAISAALAGGAVVANVEGLKPASTDKA